MIAFVPLHEQALDQVLAWRTDPAVSRYMRTDITADRDRQRQWFDRVSADPSCRHWLIRRGEKDIGLAYLSEIDPVGRNCSCGFYIGDPAFRRYGGVILPGIVNHVFTDLEFHKIHGEVMAGNDNVLKLHDLLGYRPVGVLREHVFKHGAWHDLHLFELMRDEWETRQDFYRQFRIPVVDAGGPA